MPEVVIDFGDSVRILKGKEYVKWRLSFADEVLIKERDIGEVLIARLPDGRLQATQNPKIIDSFMKVNPDLSRFYGRTA